LFTFGLGSKRGRGEAGGHSWAFTNQETEDEWVMVSDEEGEERLKDGGG
jgi:hypothetical protein